MLENIDKDQFHHGEVLEITYHNNFWDHAWFTLYQIPHSRAHQIAFILCLVFIPLLFFTILSGTSFPFTIKFVAVLLILVVLVSGAIALDFAVLAIRYTICQFDIRSLQGCRLSVSETGVFAETPYKNKAIQWSRIDQLRENSHYILFFLSDRAAFVIPKRAFVNKPDAKKLFDYSLSCFEKSREGNSLQ